MRAIDSNSLNALQGSRSGDRLVAYAWYDGQLRTPDPLPLTRWEMSWDTTRQVQSLTLEVADQSGKLAPWLFEDTLGVGGARLQVIYRVGGAGDVNLGWYRISANDVEEEWRIYQVPELGRVVRDSAQPTATRQVMVSGGASIAVNAADLALVIKNARLLAPEGPYVPLSSGATPATAVSEIKRLLADIVPVVTTPGVVDVQVAPSTVYERERLDAVEDLCDLMKCAYRMNGNGQFEIYPRSGGTPVWQIAGGPEGVLVKVNRGQSLEGLYNIVSSEGSTDVTNADGSTSKVPVIGIAATRGGVLRIDGPHGRYPLFRSSPLITTQGQADADAATALTTQTSGQTIDLDVTCLPNPALQQGDWVTVANPMVDGQALPLVGKVKTMSLSGGSSVDAMNLTVECDYAVLQQVMAGVNRG